VQAVYRFEETKENVGVYRAFMCLVQHNDGILRQVWVNKAFPQQHTVRHVLDHRLRTGAVFKSNCVANLITYAPAYITANVESCHMQPND